MKRTSTDGAPTLIYGIHPVAELLEQRPREVERIFVSRTGGGRFGRLLRQARDAAIPVSHLPAEVLARRLGARAAHQGVAAQVALAPYADAESLCRAAAMDTLALLVLLDGVVDPGNLGAILRTTAAAGAAGVLLGRENTVGLTPAVAKTSAGAIERIPVAREANPSRRLRWLADLGFRALALDPRGNVPWFEADLRDRIVVVAGGEERGLRPGILAACHQRVVIPLASGVESLNVAVAVGVLLFEATRQRRSGSSPVGSP